MKFCSQCGEALNDNVSFCNKCGSAVPASAQTEAPNLGYDQSAAYAQNSNPTNNVYVNQTFVNPQPVSQLKTNRGLVKLILLSLITFGIYSIVWFSSVSTDINLIASRYDGKKTMHYCLLLFIVSPLTFGIAAIVWFHKISARIGNELNRRGIDYSFSAGTYWLWNVLGSFILVGPFIYMHKLAVAMNKLSENYNQVG